MMRGVNVQSTVALATMLSLASAARPAIPGRLVQRQNFLCPVVCDETWCCQIGQICQAASGSDVPFECADPLFETTDSAFNLGPLLTVADSLVADNSAFISSLTAALSLTLTFPTITVLPETSEEPTTSQRPPVTEPSIASSTAAPETTTTQEDTSPSSDEASTQTETPSSTATSDAESTQEETSSSLETSSGDSTATTSSRGSSSGSTASFDPVPTSAVPAAAPKSLSPWHLGTAAVGFVVAMVVL